MDFMMEAVMRQNGFYDIANHETKSILFIKN